MRLNPSILSINADMNSPIPTKPRDIIIMMIMAAMNPMTVRWMLSMKARNRIMVPCIIAVVLAPRALPKTIEDLDMGATNISLRKPYCLSCITDIPEKRDEKSTVMPIIPGKRNAW